MFRQRTFLGRLLYFHKGFCYQAMSQACAFRLPFLVSMSVIDSMTVSAPISE